LIDISVIGIGNILLGDDGFGVHFINYLRERKSMPEDIALIDGDIDTFSIANYLSESKIAIVIDACDFKVGPPGSIERICAEPQKLKSLENNLSIHSRSLKDAVLLASIERNDLNLIIYAVQVGCVEPKLQLSAELIKSFPILEEKILADIKNFKKEEKYEQKSACH